MSENNDQEPRFPIGTVARRTGLSTHLLRAWERRYGIVEPGRTDGGVRLYSNADIVRLRLLRRLTEAGHSIGRLAPLGTAALLDLVREEEEGAAGQDAARASAGVGERYVVPVLEAVEEMDGTRSHALLMRAAVGLGSVEFVEEVVVPLLRRVGELWETGSICPAHEHMLSVAVQRVLAWLLDALPTDGTAPVLISTTPSGQRHELGAMLAGVMAADVGWRVVYFGPDLPVNDIIRAVEVTRARAVALSVIFDVERAALRQELETLQAAMPSGALVVVGGRGAEPHQEMLREVGTVFAPDLRSLRSTLKAVTQPV